MKIEVKGVIIPNDYQWIYDFLSMDAISPRVVQSKLAEANGQPVDVYINSPGGSVFAGSEIYAALRAHAGGVKIHVVGEAASAASVIMCAGTCDIAPTGMVMVHNVSGGAQGDYHDMDNASEMLKEANRAIAAAYVEKTGKTEAEILAMMDKETWLSAASAVEYGLVDSISQPAAVPLVASAVNLLSRETIEKITALAGRTRGDNNAMRAARAQFEFMKIGGMKT